MNPAKELILNTSLLLSLLVFRFCISLDTISPNQPVKDGDILVSKGKTFALGFFSPGNSGRRYVGIWYNEVPQQTVVWVANRDIPLNDTSGVLSFNGHGNLALNSQNRSTPIWSTNASISTTNNSMAQLLDSGNLVLVLRHSQRVTWQSFDYPTNTQLPLMKLGLDRRTGFSRYLTSWKSEDDPGTGSFSLGIDPIGYPQCVLNKDGTPSWRGGPWTGQRFSGIPEMNHNPVINISYVNNQDELTSVYSVTDPRVLSRLVLNESGIVDRSTWLKARWYVFWYAPKESCDMYEECGPNSYCDPYNPDKFQCTCLPGFEPNSTRDWYLRDGSGGCVRRRGVSACRSGEGFVKLARVKLPDTSIAHADMTMSLEECRQECLRNCSCTAYTSADETRGGIGCLAWHGDLVDTRVYSNAGQELYIRVDAVVLGRGSRESKNLFRPTSSSTYLQEPPSSIRELDESSRSSDLPFFDLSIIVAATDNFSDANKLGEGGFGSVYKGLLDNQKEIAVKRLSKNSGQGVEEFKNEVTIIAKLQHRNLVRILGYCVHREEKMLIYEYLPNKSLDFFIFHETKRSLIDWGRRFEIICGVARGLLYLHQDSRLRIIHRDLKASNVLLDNALNPKIADFGMARIVGGDQIEANTNRVVGTYGYMSPEYAMQGLFSVKSDVYSFGVLLLEIITGKKNSAYYNDGPSLNLIGHVWDLWREDKAMEIVDSLLGEQYANEISRCIQIGLLCVQEHATDRPTMSTVVWMLGNDTTLAYPKQPAFISKNTYNSRDRLISEGASSVNEVTITMINAR
ncbi:G-type lectin S-receptor-like serine/threonine-protein kinase RKS1 isoform X2 [Corylus avellana]|uniref:G-type lectin S-receptor-like serine/threonine-protein kinase RKS1 isoform X2 n=1 Tax=Corylus avellana TaxID=13451 RepID=UPI00286D643C|nr:G-type lectin S-receptor-like serine/threonine-protein kinase RKS1 isoform X2 [Corylus avellana]